MPLCIIRGRIDTTLPFDELRLRLLLNEVAQAADGGPDFPHRIQASLPNAVGRPAEARWKKARSLT